MADSPARTGIRTAGPNVAGPRRDAPLALAIAAVVTWLGLRSLHVRQFKPEPQLSATTLYDLLKVAFAVAVGIGGVVALVTAYRRQRVAEFAHELAARIEDRADRGEEENQKLAARTEEREATGWLLNERFATAAGQLGSESPAVRLAGIYAMAGLADDWPQRRQTCVDVLCAYLRMPYARRTGRRRGPTGPAGVPGYTRSAPHRHPHHHRPPRTLPPACHPTRLVRPRPRLHWHHIRQRHRRLQRRPVHRRHRQLPRRPVHRRHRQLPAAPSSPAAPSTSAAPSSPAPPSTSATPSSPAPPSTSATPSLPAAPSTSATLSPSPAPRFFHGQAQFADGTVYFRRAQFTGGTVYFRGAWFTGGTVDFRDAQFTGGTVYFSDAEWRCLLSCPPGMSRRPECSCLAGLSQERTGARGPQIPHKVTRSAVTQDRQPSPAGRHGNGSDKGSLPSRPPSAPDPAIGIGSLPIGRRDKSEKIGGRRLVIEWTAQL